MEILTDSYQQTAGSTGLRVEDSRRIMDSYVLPAPRRVAEEIGVVAVAPEGFVNGAIHPDVAVRIEEVRIEKAEQRRVLFQELRSSYEGNCRGLQQIDAADPSSQYHAFVGDVLKRLGEEPYSVERSDAVKEIFSQQAQLYPDV